MRGEAPHAGGAQDYLAHFDPHHEIEPDALEIIHKSTNNAALREKCAREIAEMTASLIEITFDRIDQNYLPETAPANSAMMQEMIAYFDQLIQKLKTYAPDHALLPKAEEYLRKLIKKMRMLKAGEAHTPNNEGLLSMNDKAYKEWLLQNPDVDR